VTIMDARVGIGDKWEQLLRDLGIAEQLRVCSNDDALAARKQLAAILDFFRGTAAERLSLPLKILLNALRDLQDGAAKPVKMFEPKGTKHRRRDDLDLRTIKVVSAVIMDQLCERSSREHLSRADAAKEVAKVFSEYGLSDFRGRSISATAVTKWRDQAKEAKDPEFTRQFNRLRSIDTGVLGHDAPLELKRNLLLKLRLPFIANRIWSTRTKGRENAATLDFRHQPLDSQKAYLLTGIVVWWYASRCRIDGTPRGSHARNTI